MKVMLVGAFTDSLVSHANTHNSVCERCCYSIDSVVSHVDTQQILLSATLTLIDSVVSHVDTHSLGEELDTLLKCYFFYMF